MRVVPLLLWATSAAALTIEQPDGRIVVTGERYRATFRIESAGFELELADAGGAWRLIDTVAPTVFEAGAEARLAGARTTWALARGEADLHLGQSLPLRGRPGVTVSIETVCRDDGVLIGVRVVGPVGDAVLWSPGRIALRGAEWNGYAFATADGTVHRGRIDALGEPSSYAGVSPWGDTGDCVAGLDPRRPVLLAERADWGVGLGVALIDYPRRWTGAKAFLQRFRADEVLFYTSYLPAAAAGETLWAWLAPCSLGERAVSELAASMATTPESIAPPVPEAWTRPVPDFPVELRRTAPVADIRDVAVYTIAETTRTAAALEAQRKVGSDTLIRAFFKWHESPGFAHFGELVTQAHADGMLFGGGITCSALYDGENGLSEADWRRMATRGRDGALVDAWDRPGIRHGSLSCPEYLDYLFRWCQEQIDLGVDYLFMDETNAALSDREGYDDWSLADFRTYLADICPETRDWPDDDERWRTVYGIDRHDPDICPKGGIDTFDYRAYLAALPAGRPDPLAGLWHRFRAWRDDRAWKSLCDRIRAYAAERGQRVLISGNGLVPYVDLQVLGVWGGWQVRDGRVTFEDDQLPYWRQRVRRGRELAGEVPVVFFHDWGMGDPPFPWMAVSAADRELWTRIRGAEIHAAGGHFAFPVLGPFGCDASADGTLAGIQRQTSFYQRHRDLFRRGGYLGSRGLRSATEPLTLAAWQLGERELLLHVINRETAAGDLRAKRDVTVFLPLGAPPRRVEVVSPDWDGARAATCRPADGGIEVVLPELQAYDLARLTFDGPVDAAALEDAARVYPMGLWAAGTRSEFDVGPGGAVAHADELNAFLQGMLHTELRLPPTFVVNALEPGELRVQVRAVATAGATVEFRVDGDVAATFDLPDLDGQNDGDAAEYDRLLTFTVPAGRHRLLLDNVGGDWLTMSWIEFAGRFGPLE